MRLQLGLLLLSSEERPKVAVTYFTFKKGKDNLRGKIQVMLLLNTPYIYLP